MTSSTATTWECNRCGKQVVTGMSGTPRNWIVVKFALLDPGHDFHTIGDYCNECGSTLIDWGHGDGVPRVERT